jgi:predicted acylesterase/phospholipase RssA
MSAPESSTQTVEARPNLSRTERSAGTIITFYSYKGGTGRSMTLANVAWILASNGKKVLVIDWDLEAPGLHRYFHPFLIDKDVSASDGVIDFLISFALEAVSPASGDQNDGRRFAERADLSRYAVALTHEFPKPGRLDFVPAGRQGPAYAARFNTFDWQGFYDRLHGGAFLEEAKRQMRLEYDYILIDSRTGVGDTSGICTIQMPDILVPCFTLNNQGMDGALHVTRTVFEKRGQSGIRIFPVPMRLDNAENDKLDRRSSEAETKFFPFPNHLDGDWKRYWQEVRVFYVPYYSYEEILAVYAQERREGTILAAAETLTRYLTDGEVVRIADEALPSPEERRQVQDLYAGKPLQLDPRAQWSQIAENAYDRLSSEQRMAARRVLQRLVALAPPDSEQADTARDLALDSFPLADGPILRELQASRLLRLQPDSTGKQTVGYAHEVIVDAWERLRSWLDEDRSFLLWLAATRAAADKWRLSTSVGRAERSATSVDGPLLRGEDLVVARDWLLRRPADFHPIERDYIERSLQEDDPATRSARERSERHPEAPPVVHSTIPSRDSDSVAKAREILRGRHADPRELLQLAKRLKAESRFSYARRLLLRASKHEHIHSNPTLRVTILQQLALCTYKDQDLPADERLDDALARLRETADLAVTTDQETLGLVGAIHKRKWEVDNQRQNLDRSLSYYLRGYEQGTAKDQGYTAINAAFVLDQLASLEEGEAEAAGRTSTIAEERRARARAIRQEIIETVGPLIGDPKHQWVADQWWYYATLAEAHFGLQQYDEAVRWLQEGQQAAGGLFEWELETSARQLATLARLQDRQQLKGEEFSRTPAWAALESAFGADAVPRTAFVGKIGLALSGGGFRASLYHIGVLARLAETDLLRQVEVLSCVSGGSIVGAYYYLLVRRLLQTKTEDEITQADYLAIVREMVDEFLAGVQKNIRSRVAINPFKTLRMLWDQGYSRTTRAGELYEQHLFARVADGGEHQKRWLNELTIEPLTRRSDGPPTNDPAFSPKYQNWRRQAKVPILVLNAATLNTGHTWQFTATWMGESPGSIDTEIDGNDRLRRMYYTDAPEGYREVRLGDAVGASAAVPGIFEPVTFDRLYPERIVRLVDGGVCDNQGIASLLEQDCRVMLVSDASGQMESQPAVSRGILGVLLRTNDVFQARIREAEYHDLKGRRRSGLLRGFMFVHLKGDLEVDPVDWIGCQDPYVASDEARPPSRLGPLTRYGIPKDVQYLLSAIRTDLDSFSDAEAYALMSSGYRMTQYQLRYEKCVEGVFDAPTLEPWKFLEIEECMQGPGGSDPYLRKLLSAGSSLGFKVWQIDPWLKYASRTALVVLALVVGWFAYQRWNEPLLPYAVAASVRQTGIALIEQLTTAPEKGGLTLYKVVVATCLLFSGYITARILTALIGEFLARNVVRAVRWKDTARQVAQASLLSTVGFVVATLHVHVFDRRFLRLGRLAKLKSRIARGRGR